MRSAFPLALAMMLAAYSASASSASAEPAWTVKRSEVAYLFYGEPKTPMLTITCGKEEGETGKDSHRGRYRKGVGGGTAAGVAGTATKILAATNPFTLAIALAGLSAVIFRQVMGFFNTRNRPYMMMRAQNFYFCSLANNHGALTLIADSAEEEEKEDMLLYAFLARSPSHRDALPALRVEISRFLREPCGAGVDYDAEDALRCLKEDGLVSMASDGTITTVAPEKARAHFDRLWDRLLDVDTLHRTAFSGTA